MSYISSKNQIIEDELKLKLVFVFTEVVATLVLVSIIYIIICAIKKYKKKEMLSSEGTTISEDFKVEKEMVNNEYKYEKDQWI